MSNHNYPRRLLDDAIDRAVHDLVQADPRPGFRRRVMTKVSAPARRSSWGGRFLLPAGALAAVVMLAFWLRPATSPVPAAGAPQVAEQRPLPSSAPAQSPAAGTAQPLKSVLGERTVSKGAAVASATSPRRQPPVQFTFGPRTERVAATSVKDGAAADDIDVEVVEDAATFLTALPPVRISPIEVKPILIKPIELKPIGAGASTPQ